VVGSLMGGKVPDNWLRWAISVVLMAVGWKLLLSP
jgi:hypothetical protein